MKNKESSSCCNSDYYVDRQGSPYVDNGYYEDVPVCKNCEKECDVVILGEATN